MWVKRISEKKKGEEKKYTRKTYSPLDAASVLWGSLRSTVTVAPVCLGLTSIEIFQADGSVTVAPKSLTPLLTRPLYHKKKKAEKKSYLLRIILQGAIKFSSERNIIINVLFNTIIYR